MDSQVFRGKTGVVCPPDPADVAGFATFFKRYMAGLPIEQAAVDHLKG